jgi:hypothetical protein
MSVRTADDVLGAASMSGQFYRLTSSFLFVAFELYSSVCTIILRFVLLSLKAVSPRNSIAPQPAFLKCIRALRVCLYKYS